MQIIDTSSLHATVQEGAPIGHVLLTLSVSDRDGEGSAGRGIVSDDLRS